MHYARPRTRLKHSDPEQQADPPRCSWVRVIVTPSSAEHTGPCGAVEESGLAVRVVPSTKAGPAFLHRQLRHSEKLDGCDYWEHGTRCIDWRYGCSPIASSRDVRCPLAVLLTSVHRPVTRHVFASRGPTESFGRGSRRHGVAGPRPCTWWSRR